MSRKRREVPKGKVFGLLAIAFSVPEIRRTQGRGNRLEPLFTNSREEVFSETLYVGVVLCLADRGYMDELPVDGVLENPICAATDAWAPYM